METISGMESDPIVLLRAAARSIEELSGLCDAEPAHDWLRRQLLLAAGANPSAPRKHLSQEAIQWLVVGDRCASAETIFTHLTGVDALLGIDAAHPEDAGSFGRCRKLLEQCPGLAERFPAMRFVSPYWHALVPEWDALCAAMDAEAPNWRSNRGVAPGTFTRIKNIAQTVREKERH